LSESITPFLEKQYDHLLFSYHGLPVRHLKNRIQQERIVIKLSHVAMFNPQHGIFAINIKSSNHQTGGKPIKNPCP